MIFKNSNKKLNFTLTKDEMKNTIKNGSMYVRLIISNELLNKA